MAEETGIEPRSIPYIFMITDEITSANINKSKYLFIIDDGSIGVDDDVDSVVVLAAFWILNPKINDEIPIKKKTIVRTFCVRPGMIVIGVPWLDTCCCCCCALTVLLVMHTNDRDNKITVHVNKNNNNMIKRLGNNLGMVMVMSINNNPPLPNHCHFCF
ncbi:MAG: hypothetical protein WBE34_00750 [Candidatus Nitrosopolaris sp.]